MLPVSTVKRNLIEVNSTASVSHSTLCIQGKMSYYFCYSWCKWDIPGDHCWFTLAVINVVKLWTLQHCKIFSFLHSKRSYLYWSPMYLGSTSDVEFTTTSGLLPKLENKGGIGVMADWHFAIQDKLDHLDIKLNIPPFLEGHKQLPAKEVEKGRQTASLHIHMECAIGCIKNFAILKCIMPITMTRLTNQIVCIFAWLSNFQPALFSPPDIDSTPRLRVKLKITFDHCMTLTSTLIQIFPVYTTILNQFRVGFCLKLVS